MSLDDSLCKSYVLAVLRERIVVYEDGADLLRDAVVREVPMWEPVEYPTIQDAYAHLPPGGCAIWVLGGRAFVAPPIN